MSFDLEIYDFTSAIIAAVYAIRVELSFCVIFTLIWYGGRLFGFRALDSRGKQGRYPKFTPPPSPTKRTTPAVRSPGDAQGSLSSQLDSAKLQDPTRAMPHILQLCRSQPQQAVSAYWAAKKAGLDLQRVSESLKKEVLSELITISLRFGQSDSLALLRELRQSTSDGVTSALVASVCKLSTSKQHFQECLSIYDFVAEDKTFKIDDKSVWSCLLFCSIETKEYRRCKYFYESLKATGVPSQKDCGNMVRYAAIQRDWQLSLALVAEMQQAGLEVDNVVYNTALATCIGTGQVDQARALLDDMQTSGSGVADVITYNTLAKGYAKAGRLEECFELNALMRSRGIEPSQVTYGILLDACINENKVERAAEVFDTMVRENCPMNTILYTTLIKGFARAGQVDQAMRVYEQMRGDRGVHPDVITFSILIKANCDSCRLEPALRLLEGMIDLGLKPDEVVFNNLIGGCIKDNNANLAKRLYQDMVKSGLRPSNATFSILIRLYAQCHMLDEAVDLLRHEPKAQGVDPEPRLFSQLAQSCLRERQGRRAVEVYTMLLERSPPTAAVHSSMLGMCVKLNMLDTAAELLTLAASSDSRVDSRDAIHVYQAATRKKKTQCAEACSAAMTKMGIDFSGL